MKSSGIGGQAVLEGVMMKNKEKYAIAVRKPDNEIEVSINEYKGINDKISIFKYPVLRGMAAFVDSMVIGMKALTYSSSFYEEEEEKAKAKKTENKKSESIATFFTFLFSIVIAIGIFVLLPMKLSELLSDVIPYQAILALIEGVIRLGLFVGYVAAISLMKDIKRVFMYHGAEHKTINCIEHGYELTVENVRKQSKEHKRCGTSFMLFVMVLSIVLFMFIRTDTMWLRFALRILLIPVIAGLSYEILRLGGRYNNTVINIISAPGMWLQRLTTKEPDDSMIEVAIASVEAVFDWRAFLEGSKPKKKKAKKNAHEKKQQAENKQTVEKKQPVKQEEQAEKEAGRISSSEIAASLEPKGEEEDDEILKALDHYFPVDGEDKE